MATNSLKFMLSKKKARRLESGLMESSGMLRNSSEVMKPCVWEQAAGKQALAALAQASCK